MRTRIIALCNHKGGVAKTTTVASLGSALARSGYKVLLVDLDAQANLTESFTNQEPARSTYEAIKEREELPILHIEGSRLDLAPASLDLAGIELEIAAYMQREIILKDLIEPVKDKYHYIILDCPPSLGLVTLNALAVATDVVIPLTAEGLPSRGLAKITDFIGMVKARLNKELNISGILLTRFERGKLGETVEAALRETYGDKVLTTKIRKNCSLAEAPLALQDIYSYAATSNGAKDYQELAAEVEQRIPVEK